MLTFITYITITYIIYGYILYSYIFEDNIKLKSLQVSM